jgi:SAM-dependent methyltransferase
MLTDFIAERRSFHDGRAHLRPAEQQRYYNALLRHYYQFFIPANARVLEVGCGVGDLLAAVKPVYGLGIDFSARAVAIAQERHPHLHFIVAEAETFTLNETFDYIILSDLTNDLGDVQKVLETLRSCAHERTRLVLNFFSNVWRPILSLGERCRLKAPMLLQNWLSSTDMRNLLELGGWELIKQEAKILSPVHLAFIENFLNHALVPALRHLCLTTFQVARVRPVACKKDPSCSVVIPARNEEGNIEAAVTRLPKMGSSTEIIFVEGHSKDRTWEEIHRVADKHTDWRIKVLKQKSKGKGGAVREAFEVATGDILMILDADLTMPPEELPKFYEVLRSGRAEFVNGVRLVYPMEDEAMRFLNMVANKFFGVAFSWMIGQPIKDTLCGTKVLFRRDYQEIARNRSYFGEFDPFGDFDLIFGAARLNLKIVDMPIRYQARHYGETNIDRWRHGALLFRMLGFAATRLKFL